jgi:hypothetical protein
MPVEVTAAVLGTGGRTGVVTLNDDVSFSNEFLAVSVKGDGVLLLGVVGLSAWLCVTTATIGRRGRLFRIVRLRDGAVESDSVTVSNGVRFLDCGAGELDRDCSSARDARPLEPLAEGDGDLLEEFDIHGLRARLTNLPDIERALEGRATGSGALVSGISVSGAFGRAPGSSALVGSDTSSVETLNRETVMVDFSLERREVRRKISFPASTSSFDGDEDSFGYVKSENVLRRVGEADSAATRSGRWL